MSQLQCMRVWRACTRSLPSTLPTIIRSIPGKQPAHLPNDSAAVRIVSSPCGPTVPSKTRRAPKYRARPFVIMRGPPLGSLLHLKICSVAIETNVSFTLVPETNAYMPSNCVVAVGGDRDCAAAAAEKPQIPPIHSQPTLFRTCIPSRPNSRLDRASPGHPRLSAPENKTCIRGTSPHKTTSDGVLGAEYPFLSRDRPFAISPRIKGSACPELQIANPQTVSRPLPGLFLPDEIIAARISDLARAYRSTAIYIAVEIDLDRPVAAAAIGRRDYAHRQLALRSNRASELVAASGGIPRLTVRNVEWPRSAARALAQPPAPRHVGCIDLRRRNNSVAAVGYRCARRRRRCLRNRSSRKATNSNDPRP